MPRTVEEVASNYVLAKKQEELYTLEEKYHAEKRREAEQEIRELQGEFLAILGKHTKRAVVMGEDVMVVSTSESWTTIDLVTIAK